MTCPAQDRLLGAQARTHLRQDAREALGEREAGPDLRQGGREPRRAGPKWRRISSSIHDRSMADSPVLAVAPTSHP